MVQINGHASFGYNIEHLSNGILLKAQYSNITHVFKHFLLIALSVTHYRYSLLAQFQMLRFNNKFIFERFNAIKFSWTKIKTFVYFKGNTISGFATFERPCKT